MYLNYPPGGVISTNQFKNGTHIEVDGTVFKIVEFQHVKPGKGGAFVRSKLKRISDGAVIDSTFRAGEKFRPVRTETRRMQYLYADGTDAHFMDLQTYDQLTVPQDTVVESLKWVVENEEVEVLYVDEAPTDVQVPSAVELAVADTEPGLRGDTASGRRRQARHAGVRGDGARAPVRGRGRSGPGGHALRRIRLARVVRWWIPHSRTHG